MSKTCRYEASGPSSASLPGQGEDGDGSLRGCLLHVAQHRHSFDGVSPGPQFIVEDANRHITEPLLSLERVDDRGADLGFSVNHCAQAPHPAGDERTLDRHPRRGHEHDA